MLCVGQQKKKIEKKTFEPQDCWTWYLNLGSKLFPQESAETEGISPNQKARIQAKSICCVYFFPGFFFSFAQLTFAYSTSFGNWFCLFLDLPCLEFWSEWFNIPLDHFKTSKANKTNKNNKANKANKTNETIKA